MLSMLFYHSLLFCWKDDGEWEKRGKRVMGPISSFKLWNLFLCNYNDWLLNMFPALANCWIIVWQRKLDGYLGREINFHKTWTPITHSGKKKKHNHQPEIRKRWKNPFKCQISHVSLSDLHFITSKIVHGFILI